MNNKLISYIVIIGAILILVITGSFLIYNSLFDAPSSSASAENFVVSLNQSNQDAIKNLHDQGFIRSEFGFNIASGNTIIVPGSYKISKNLDAWKLIIALKTPYMKWIVIPEGFRKEQIAEILAKELGWSDQDKKNWVTKYTAVYSNNIEGVYFPDSYLIPVDDTPEQVAQIFTNHFNDKFKPYADKFVKANIKWTTALKIASIIQREAAGTNDMPLIAGIIWNRLEAGMRLDIDSTIQYIKDDVAHYGSVPNGPQLLNYTSDGSWWLPIKSGDTSIKSAYNTYLNSGLPPHPICNPGLDAIDAVLNPAKTQCIYYLHDSNGQIHCSVTYAEHQQNINKYLK